MPVSLWCVCTVGITDVSGVIYRIGVKFGVARFDRLGNSQAP